MSHEQYFRHVVDRLRSLRDEVRERADTLAALQKERRGGLAIKAEYEVDI